MLDQFLISTIVGAVVALLNFFIWSHLAKDDQAGVYWAIGGFLAQLILGFLLTVPLTIISALLAVNRQKQGV